MDLLVVQDTDWVRRGPHQQHHLFERLQARGHSVRVLDFPLLWRREAPWRLWRPAEAIRAAPRIAGSGISVERPGILRVPLLDFATYARGVRRLLLRQLKARRPDVIVGHGILGDRAVVRSPEAGGIPYVAHWLDALDRLVQPAWARPWARRILRQNLQAADRLIVINRALARYAARLGAKPSTTRVVPAGLDVERFGDERARARTRQELGIPTEHVVLLFYGWLYRFSGVDVVARAVLRGPRNVHLVVAGDGDLLARLQALAKKSSGDRRLHVLGPQPYDRIPALLAAADAALLPAPRHPTMDPIVPIKLYEYLAAGRRVYATRLPGVLEEFGGHPAFRFVERPEDVLPAVVADAPDPRKTVARARTLRAGQEKHAWPRVVARFERELGRACGR